MKNKDNDDDQVTPGMKEKEAQEREAKRPRIDIDAEGWCDRFFGEPAWDWEIYQLAWEQEHDTWPTAPSTPEY